MRFPAFSSVENAMGVEPPRSVLTKSGEQAIESIAQLDCPLDVIGCCDG